MVHPCAWPSPGSYLSQGFSRGGVGTSRVRLPPTGTGTMALKSPIDFFPWGPLVGPTICLTLTFTLTLVNALGQVGTVIKSDQEEARKCYENSLKTKRGVFTVTKRPGQEETPMDVEPLEASPKEYVHMGRTPVEAEPMVGTPVGAEPGNEAPVGGVARGDAGCGVARAEDARERRPEPLHGSPQTCLALTRISYAITSPWTPRFVQYGRKEESLMRRSASLCRRRRGSCLTPDTSGRSSTLSGWPMWSW